MSVVLSVGMPSYNEETNLRLNVPRLAAKLAEVQPSFEIVIVDDGSQDKTPEVADCLAAEDPRIRVIHHSVNRGIGSGFVSAARAARGKYFIIIPADLALDLNELHKYLDAADNADVVVGRRSSRMDYSAFRKLVSVVNIWLIQTLFGMPQKQFNYINLYRTRLLQDMNIQYTNSAFFFAEILVKARDQGCRITEVDIEYVPRSRGKQTGANQRLILRTLADMAAYWGGRHWKVPTALLPLVSSLRRK